MSRPNRPHTEPRWLYVAAGVLMTGGPVWRYLYANHYPFTRLEAWVLPVLAALLGGVTAAVAHRLGGLLGSLVFGALLFVFTDLQFNLDDYFYTAAIVLACGGLSLIFRGRRAAIAVLALGAFYAASLIRPTRATSVVRPEPTVAHPGHRPVLLHIILDEEWGIGGLRAAGDTATARFLATFYRDRGFEVFDAAYSRSVLTQESIPGMLSLGQPTRLTRISKEYQFRMRDNPYFRRLQDLGYRIVVFQSSFIDFCRPQGVTVSACHVTVGNSIANIGSLGGRWTTRAILAARYFLNMNSHVYVRLHPDAVMWRRSNVGGGIATAVALRDAIAVGPTGGIAYFAHLLLPHRPVDVDANCDALSNPNDRLGLTPDSLPPWPRKMALEAGQIRCTHRMLAEILATLDETVGREGAIVIVQGDHGARLHRKPPKDIGLSQVSREDLNTMFSTLLAVRRPGWPAAARGQPVPVQDALWQLARSGFAGPVVGPWPQYVRQAPTRAVRTDTLRWLTRDDMPWADSVPGRSGDR